MNLLSSLSPIPNTSWMFRVMICWTSWRSSCSLFKFRCVFVSWYSFFVFCMNVSASREEFIKGTVNISWWRHRHDLVGFLDQNDSIACPIPARQQKLTESRSSWGFDQANNWIRSSAALKEDLHCWARTTYTKGDAQRLKLNIDAIDDRKSVLCLWCFQGDG